MIQADLLAIMEFLKGKTSAEVNLDTFAFL